MTGCWRLRARYLLYLSTLSSGASAAHDLHPAVAALTRPAPAPSGAGPCPAPYDPRPAALLSVFYCQDGPAPDAGAPAAVHASMQRGMQ
jgi:hypothetical protein